MGLCAVSHRQREGDARLPSQFAATIAAASGGKSPRDLPWQTRQASTETLDFSVRFNLRSVTGYMKRHKNIPTRPSSDPHAQARAQKQPCACRYTNAQAHTVLTCLASLAGAETRMGLSEEREQHLLPSWETHRGPSTPVVRCQLQTDPRQQLAVLSSRSTP